MGRFGEVFGFGLRNGPPRSPGHPKLRIPGGPPPAIPHRDSYPAGEARFLARLWRLGQLQQAVVFLGGIGLQLVLERFPLLALLHFPKHRSIHGAVAGGGVGPKLLILGLLPFVECGQGPISSALHSRWATSRCGSNARDDKTPKSQG
jgi:hypothetical protein